MAGVEHPRHKEVSAPTQGRGRPHGLGHRERRFYLQTRERAESQAETIRLYWADRGIEVGAFIVPAGTGEFTVRSDLKLTASPDEVRR